MKKKIISFIMAFMLLLVGGFTLVGCDEEPTTEVPPAETQTPSGETTPTHTHEYVGDPYYTVKEGKAYSYTTCSCGEKSSETELTNAIIVTPTTVQSALDGKVVKRNGKYVVDEAETGEIYETINGKTLVFDAGTYSSILEFRPTKESNSKVYEIQDLYDVYKLGDEIQYSDLTETSVANYVRTFSNITFAGTQNSKITELFDIRVANIISDVINPARYDAIKGVTASTTKSEYFSHLNFDNVTFTRLNFEGPRGRIHYFNTNKFTTISNIAITNCNFTTTTTSSDHNGGTQTGPADAAVVFNVYNGDKTRSNFTFSGNVVDGYYQGFYSENLHNVNVLNNVVKNTIHNAFAFQSSESGVSGYINIKNNHISNVKGSEGSTTRDRAIRFKFLVNATVLIEGNTFVDCAEDRTANNEGVQLIAAVSLTNSSYEFKNNNYNGNTVENTSGSTTFIIYIVEPVFSE